MSAHPDSAERHGTEPARRGRPAGRIPEAERSARREQVLRAALEELVERGYEQATMSRIAARASASKETLYSWFGDKVGVFTAVIEANADRSLAVPDPDRIDGSHDTAAARSALLACASGLLALLTSPESVAMNRAAMASPALAEILHATGRGRSGPLVVRYLARLDELGLIAARDPEESFRLFYGLVVQDAQIGVLLGAPRPGDPERAARAEVAVDRFLRLVAAQPSLGR